MKRKMSDKIGVFGGTFNPPHIGHRRLAEHFQEELQLDRLLVIPTFLPPHKESATLVSSEDRLAMCRLAFPNAQVSDIEIQRGGKSYTVETLRQIKAQNPTAELFLIVGSDMLLSFDKWYMYEEILSMCTLCAADREGESSRLSANGVPSFFDGRRLIMSPLPAFEVSSTEIRKLLAEGKPTTGLLSDAVRAYIDERGLYR